MGAFSGFWGFVGIFVGLETLHKQPSHWALSIIPLFVID